MNEINFKLKNKCGIYSFINLVNGKRYVGSSVDLYNRLHEHYHNLKNNKAHNKHFQSAWNKYGEDNFMYNIIEFCDENVRFDREQYYINSLEPEYNLTLQVIANFGHSPSEETRQKISNTLKEKYASGEITTYRQDHNWKKVWIYNINTFTLEAECDCSADACRLVGYKKSNYEEYRVYKDHFIMTRTPFENYSQLRQYIDQYVTCANSTKGKYLIVDDGNQLNYFSGVSAVTRRYGTSKSTLNKHLEATKENPYIIKKLNYKFYFTDEYIPVNYTAVPIEKSSELLSGNIGESPQMVDNTEINSEIAKGSESSYSIESE